MTEIWLSVEKSGWDIRSRTHVWGSFCRAFGGASGGPDRPRRRGSRRTTFQTLGETKAGVKDRLSFVCHNTQVATSGVGRRLGKVWFGRVGSGVRFMPKI